MKAGLVFLDTETTGTSGSDEVCQVSAVKLDVDTLRTVAEFNQYVNPRADMNPKAQKVHQIDPKVLAAAPRMEEVWPQLKAFVAGSRVIAHHALFDERMVDQSLAAAGLTDRLARACDGITCSLEVAKGVYGRKVSLDLWAEITLQRKPRKGAHDALTDARLLCDVYLAFEHALRGNKFWNTRPDLCKATPWAEADRAAIAGWADRWDFGAKSLLAQAGKLERSPGNLLRALSDAGKVSANQVRLLFLELLTCA